MAKVQARRAAAKKTAPNNTVKKIAVKTASKKAAAKPAFKTVFRQDVKQTATLVKADPAGGANTIRKSKALGLPITYMEDHSVILELPNGVKTVLATLTDADINTPAVSLKKGMIFHSKK
jgi:hypothetical protein